MLLSVTNLVAAAAMLICALVQAVKVRSSERDSVAIQGESLFNFDSDLHKRDDQLLYYSCRVATQRSHLDCTMTRKRFSRYGDAPQEENCRFQVSTTRDRNLSSLRPPKSMGTNSATVQWHERDRQPSRRDAERHEILLVVNLGTCRATRLELAYEFGPLRDSHPFYTELVAHGSGFELVSPNRRLCDSRLCRASFNEEGARVGGAVPFPTDIVTPKVVTLVPDGYPRDPLYLVNSDDDSETGSFRAEMVAPSGRNTPLLVIDDPDLLTSSVASGAQRLFSLCWRTKQRTVKCAQFRGEERRWSFETLELSTPGRLKAMHASADGSLLLLTVGKGERLEDASGHSFNITKVYPNGSYDHPLELGGFSHFKCGSIPESMTVAIFEYVDEICVHAACTRSRSGRDNALSFGVKCIRKEN